MTAIPNYSRMNRVGPPVEYLGDTNVNYAPGASTPGGTKPSTNAVAAALPNDEAGDRRARKVDSKVWI
jgi:hypothetical protein